MYTKKYIFIVIFYCLNYELTYVSRNYVTMRVQN